MKNFHLALSTGLAVALTLSSGCRRKKTEPTPPTEQPAAQQASPVNAPPPTIAPQPQAPDTQASLNVFQTSTEFEDLTKDFQLYCNFKKRVPTDINEFFRDQKIRPPAIPPGTRLAIDPKERRIILVK